MIEVTIALQTKKVENYGISMNNIKSTAKKLKKSSSYPLR